MSLIRGGGGISDTDAATLKYIKYNPTTNKLDATRTISTEPSSIDIGNHTVSSGGENAFFTNRTYNIDWFPAWTGLKDQSVLANQGGTGVIPPTFRQYTSDITDVEIEGAVSSEIVDYDVQSTVAINTSAFAQEIVCGEEIEADDWLFYYVRVGSDSDPIVYQQIITGVSRDVGDVFHWDFDHPVEGRAGITLTSQMWIAKGSQDANKTLLQVRAGTADASRRYVKVFLRTFDDEDVMSGVLFTTTSQVIRYAATYAVDTAAAQVVLTVDEDIGYKSFVVFDADKNFHQNSCVVDFGGAQGTATLQTKNDSFLFYWDGSQWRYLDLNTKRGGVV